jgi:hypothetical protein
MDAREHAYRVMAIIERHRTDLGGSATNGGPGCAPVRRDAATPAVHRTDQRRPAVAYAAGR